ncbi:helix-turn-helix domain-containing protein [Flavitalea flava]
MPPALTYKEFKPCSALSRFIEVYWHLHIGSHFTPVRQYIFADGLTEIFTNLGNSVPVIDGTKFLKPGKLYFGGTMTTTSTFTRMPNSDFAGIRLKPGGIAAFYSLNLSELVDQIIDFPDPELQGLLYPDDQLGERLDSFFSRKLNTRILPVVAITESVSLHRGLITVDQLARQHHISKRSLERHFNAAIGVGPKEFIKVIRFQHLLKKLKAKDSQESLLQIACEMGYYDHAHLTREVRRYGGQNPSSLAQLKEQ